MSNDEFLARLNRISDPVPKPVPAMAGADTPADPPQQLSSMRRRPPRRVSPLLIVGIVGFAVCAFVVLTLSNKIVGFYGAMTGTHVLTVEGQPLKADDAMPAPAAGPTLPIDALPSAPAGWVKITQRDALAGDLMERVAASWPAEAVPLEQNAGYKRLDSFAKIYAKEDVETRLTANRKTSALYLSHSGSYANVSMVYRAKDRLLGGKNDPQAWADQLEFEAHSKLQKGQMVERIELAGITAVNATREAGVNPLERPLAVDVLEPTKMNLRAGLTERALISLQGHASAQEVEAIIAGVDMGKLP